MNTISTTASTNTILAIDLGKYKSVACVHNQGTGEFGFTTFETTRAELRRLVSKEQPAVIIIEACLLAGWVHDLCGELGVNCLVAYPGKRIGHRARKDVWRSPWLSELRD